MAGLDRSPEDGVRKTPEGLRRTLAVAALAAAVVVLPALREGAIGVEERQQVALVGWLLIAFGIALGILPRAVPPRQAWLVGAAFAGLTATTAAGLLWTSSAERTVEELARCAALAAVPALAWLTLERRSWLAAATGIAAAAVGVCALAVFSRLAPAVIEPAVAEVNPARLAYPLGYWNALAAWSAMAVAITLAWSAGYHRPLGRSIALASLPVCALALWLTYSRGGLVAAGVGVACVVALSRERTRAARHAVLGIGASAVVVGVAESQAEIADGAGGAGGWLVALALIAAAAVAVAVARSGRTEPAVRDPRPEAARHARVLSLVALATVLVAVAVAGVAAGPAGEGGPGAPTAPQSDARLLTLSGNRPEYWAAALDAVAAEPLHGIGPGTFEFWWSGQARAPEQVRDAHSLYFETLAELGPLGFAAAITLVGSLLWLAWTPVRLAERHPAALALPVAVALYAGLAAIDWLWESTAVGVLALAAASIAAASGASRRDPSRRPRLATRAGLLAVALAGAAVQVPGLLSAGREQAARAASARGALAAALEHADGAVHAAPWAASPYAERAKVELDAGRLRAARTDATRAIERERENFRRWLLLATIERRAGRPAAARAAFERAQALAPIAPWVVESRPMFRPPRRPGPAS